MPHADQGEHTCQLCSPRQVPGRARSGLSLAPSPARISTDSLASAQALDGLEGIGGEAPPASGGGGCGCACSQGKAGSSTLTKGGGEAGAPDAPKPVQVDKPTADDHQHDTPSSGGGSGSGGGGGGGGAVQEFKAGAPKKLSGEAKQDGLTAKAQQVLGAAQAQGLMLISGLRAGETQGHGNGSAVDVANVPGGSKTGSPEMESFAEAARAAGKAGDPNIGYVIYRQRIASARDNWAWRPMEDRGSNTQNHFDHVHVSTDPNR